MHIRESTLKFPVTAGCISECDRLWYKIEERRFYWCYTRLLSGHVDVVDKWWKYFIFSIILINKQFGLLQENSLFFAFSI